MKRDALVRIAVLALLAALGAWLVTATEWAEEQVEQPPRGEAARNRFFAAEQFIRQTGGQVLRRQELDTLPPAGARLVLESQHWDLFPERAGRLRQWVESGGHLVVPATLADDKVMAAWLPLVVAEHPRNRPPRPVQRDLPAKERHCREVAEPAGVTPAYGEPGRYRLCLGAYWRELRPAVDVAPQWALAGPDGIEVLRMPVGRGSVTVHTPLGLLHNRHVVQGDHALVAAAALQLRPGALVWLVAEESRPPLLFWIWRHGWVAVLLALAALGAWLWRSGVRFGPVGAVPPRERRSMKEQVAGTGAFLRHHGPAALHAAQVRALQETARTRLPGYAALGSAAGAEAIAKATSLDPAALEAALRSGLRTPHALPADLELLEAARRRLLHLSSFPRPS